MSHARRACPKEGQYAAPRTLNQTWDAPLDSSRPQDLHSSRKPWVESRSSARRPRHATQATNSLSTRGSLQLLPGPSCREADEPPDDTRTLVRQGGAPQRLQRGGKSYSGGGLQRRRNSTRGNARNRVHNRTLTHRRGRNGTLLDATQPGRNGTRENRGRLDATTLIRTNARRLSDARNTHGGKTWESRTRVDHGVVNCG
jgi:hypothetical protein